MMGAKSQADESSGPAECSHPIAPSSLMTGSSRTFKPGRIFAHGFAYPNFLNWNRLAAKFGSGRGENTSRFNEGALKFPCSGDQVSFQKTGLA